MIRGNRSTRTATNPNWAGSLQCDAGTVRDSASRTLLKTTDARQQIFCSVRFVSEENYVLMVDRQNPLHHLPHNVPILMANSLTLTESLSIAKADLGNLPQVLGMS